MKPKPHALEFATVEELSPLLSSKKISPVELIKIYLARIEALGPQLNTFVTVTAESALAEARAAEREISRGDYRGPLHGIPIVLKDNLWTRGVRTTAGSTILREFVPEEDATVVRKLRGAGAVFLGKTNMHEFAYGITGENPHYGATRNPWDPQRISGGSSGGSAIATAAGMCVASVGTDTGGSIRVPAALCGIVGLKPTFGRISRHGVVPLSLSLDHVGLLARSVHDAALLLRFSSGYDHRDPASVRRPPEKFFGSGVRKRVKIRLGLPQEFFWARLDPEVRRLTEAAVKDLAKGGATLEEVSLPAIGQAIEAGNLVAMAEATAYHQSAGYFPSRAAEYGEDVRTRLTAGREVRAVDFLATQETIRKSRSEFDAAFAKVDAIVAPTTPMPATPIGAERVQLDGSDESIRSALVGFSRPANLTGLPAISVPCGFTPDGLPVGMQFIGRPFDEATLLDIARHYERDHDWRFAHPPLALPQGQLPSGSGMKPSRRK